MKKNTKYKVYIKTTLGVITTHVVGNLDFSFEYQKAHSHQAMVKLIYSSIKENIAKHCIHFLEQNANKEINELIESKIFRFYGVHQDSRKQYFVLDNTLEIPDDVQELNFSKSGIIISEEDFLSKTFEGYVLNCSSVFSREIVEFCLAIKDYFFLGKSINIDSLLKKITTVQDKLGTV